MAINSSELIRAREAIESVLEQLDVDAYLFEVEPSGEQWELKVECAIEQGWGSFTVALAQPPAGSEEEQAVLLEQCRTALAACKRERCN
ncbi:MAG: hypothetical protein OQK54_04095 [Gammaproteobacteria bacterium]|nr:hypothetical protein [Gammaproteobacteria bacterium]